MEIVRDKHVVVGVCGSIAAYKALSLTRLLVRAGAQVWPVLTPGASRFVAPMSFTALAGRPAITDLWQAAANGEIGHVELAHRAALVVVAPCSASALFRLAHGDASCPLSALTLASGAPLLLAPAMETGMWENPATQDNVRRLVERGAKLLAPLPGLLASGRQGTGRMREPESIFAAIEAALCPQDLAGRRLVVTAGPTREAFDPVRYLSNPSTGKMGFALARAAQKRGAKVRLIAGPCALADPEGVETVRINTTAQLLAACQAALPGACALLMAAAPADFCPTEVAPYKVKKPAPEKAVQVTLQATPDILTTLEPRRHGCVAVGFAAETDDVMAHGRDKLRRKDLDMLVANHVGGATTGFASDTNAGWLLQRDAPEVELPLMRKEAMAHVILDHLAMRLGFP